MAQNAKSLKNLGCELLIGCTGVCSSEEWLAWGVEKYPDIALLERHAGARAADALRAPFVLGDRENLRRIFEDAGVTSVSVTTHRGTAHFPGLRVLVEADLRGWLPVMGVNLDEVLIGRILDDAEEALGAYVDADGRVAFDTPAHLVTGMRP